MPEDFNSVKCDHGNVILVPRQEIRIALNVHYAEKVKFFAVGVLDYLLGDIAKMTAWSGVDDDLSFQWSIFQAAASGNQA